MQRSRTPTRKAKPAWRPASREMKEISQAMTMEPSPVPVAMSPRAVPGSANRDGPPACVLPPSPTLDAPVLTDLQIKRDYLPQELTVFQGLGIKPPPHTITLKARMDPTP